MEYFALYLFKSAIWLSGFALIYFLFLRNEKFFILKRYYLLLGLVASIIFPFISVKYQVEIPAPSIFVPAEYAEYTGYEPVKTNQFNYKHLLLFFYCTGVIVLIIKLMTQLNSIYKIIRRSPVERLENAKLVCTDLIRSPFSFFNYIFMKPSIKGKEKEMIMNHELVHVKQKHWIDLVFTELVRLIQWINPLVWVYASFIRQNNEYIADEITVKYSADPAIYQATLLNQLFDSPIISLSNTFSYSLNKKRFEMMKTTIRSPYRKARILFVLPVFALLMFAFAEETYVYPSQNDGSATGTAAREISDNKIKGTVYDSKGDVIPGVNVIITGTTAGTVTDVKGNFILAGVSGDDSITVARHGFMLRTIHVGNNTEFAITLIDDERFLPPPPPPPDVLNRSKEEPTLVFIDGVSVQYSEIEKIDPKDIISSPQSDPASASPSHVSPVDPPADINTGSHPRIFIDGVLTSYSEMQKINPSNIISIDVIKDNSRPAQNGDGDNRVIYVYTKKEHPADPVETSKSTINYRPFESDRTLGVRTAIGKTPLYIVDGVTIENFDHYKIDPDVIDSISVLKDKSATELYGEKGENGVIIIKTKR